MVQAADHCGLTPREFWQLEPYEFEVMLEAAIARNEREWRWQAVLAADVVNYAGKSLKRTVTADDILGIAKKPTKRKWRTAAEVMRENAARGWSPSQVIRTTV
jgi:hypothetical protein